MNIQSVEKFEIRSSNEPSGGVYSYKNGHPIITFEMGAAAKLLKASTLRINGQIQVFTGAGAAVDNLNLKGTVAPPPVIPQPLIVTNSRTDLDELFQNVSISSANSNMFIESIRQYGRLASTLTATTHSAGDLIQNKAVSNLSTGQLASSSVMLNNKVSFSLLNSGTAIPLGVNGVNGLYFNLELVPDSQFLFGTDAPTGGGAYYEISNLSMTGDLLIPDAVGIEKLSIPGSGAFSYNSFNNIYSVLNSSDSTQTHNLASSNVLSIFHNFLPVTHINNYNQDGFKTDMFKNTVSGVYSNPVVLDKVSFSREGVKLGLDCELECATQSAQGLPETEVMVNALNAIKNYSSLSSMSNQPRLLPYGTNDIEVFGSELQSTVEVDSADRNFSIGLELDRISNQGVSFKTQPYATRIQSSLDGNSPMATYTYYLSKNTLVYFPQGVMVQN